MNKNRHRLGFTLIEILIVIVIFAILSITVLIALDPIEQINRGRDTKSLTFSAELYNSIDRVEARSESVPILSDVVAAPLDSNFGITTLYQLMEFAEIKPSFIYGHQKELPNIFLTVVDSFQNKAVCFLPKSKSFRDHYLSIYSASGEKREECPQEGCYLCFSSVMAEIDPSAYDIPGGIELISTPSPSVTPTVEEEDDVCGDFDPQWPNFAWTFGESDTFAKWGCTNFSTTDWGCDNLCSRDHECTPCPEGQRKLVKFYYATKESGDFELCLSHYKETREEYCVSDPYARCDLTRYPFGSMAFIYGCSNPRRPIIIIEEYFR